VVRCDATSSENEFPFALRTLETSMMMYARRTYEWICMLSAASKLCGSDVFGISLSELPRNTSRESGILPMLWRFELSVVFLELAWMSEYDMAVSSSSRR
jgi:hypothetical protein